VASENPAVFTNEERNRVLYHLGYLLADRVTTLALGIPSVSNAMFLAESALGRIPQSAKQDVSRLLGILDGIDSKLVEAQDYLVAQKLGEMTLRDDHPDLLEKEYCRWAKRLSDTLGAPLNPYSERFRNIPGMPRPMNIPVIHS
jgi:hypothetical protein